MDRAQRAAPVLMFAVQIAKMVEASDFQIPAMFSIHFSNNIIQNLLSYHFHHFPLLAQEGDGFA
ncbi:MAG: hypothetical protein DRG76_07855 [Deltaproteobacteria bacterium]|nr:MAG: hypothetical protein DRG76_07855 [Deltaproteobacteria bacterium]